ncbi:oligosaccharide flippase family protein [Mesobacillus sp. AQ2]|uniref:oligosaccharide flippase family protein n=1 Tax=Mesobacillus sp. AQ2 TaxID=3043332 RepID=UPI0024C1071C|nr:oligosaccharide flippase family protein [Mesobacillus sp. AQ2]WHX40382.1 oligosaccharide flippase family protein [Mesobacillus sp. AQ2]
MEESLKRFASRLVSFSLGPAVAGLIGLIIVPITTYFVLPNEFGKASMYTLTYTLGSLIIYFGLDQSFLREYHSNPEKRKVFANSVILPLTLSVVLCITFLLFYKNLSLILFNEINFLAIFYLSISLILAIINRFSLLKIRIQEKAILYSAFIILNKFIEGLLLLIILIYFDRSFIGIISATFFSLLIITFIQFLSTMKDWTAFLSIDKVLIKKLLDFGLPLVPASIVIWIFNSMDRLALKSWSTYDELGIYSAAFKIVGFLAIFQQSFATFWIPTAYRWFESNVSNERFEKVGQFSMFYMGLIFIGIISFKDIIIQILGASYSVAALSVPFLLFSPLMYTISECTSLGIAFKRKTNYNILISVIVAILNLIGNYFLVPEYGALGASISTGISYIAFFWLRTMISRQLWYKFEVKIYILNTVLMVVIAAASLLVDSLVLNIFFVLLLCLINLNTLKYSVLIVEKLLRGKK